MAYLPTTTMDMSLPSELGYEVIARDAVAAFAHRHGIPAERIEDLKTALSEACINAIEHGNSLRPELRVQVSCSFVDNRLTVEVLDQGIQTVTTNHQTLDISDKIAGKGSFRGMGLMLIKQLCDEAGFIPHSAAGNCFRFAVHCHNLPPASAD